MTKEEVASIVKYCNDNGVSYKSGLSELGVPEWKFFESKRRYAKEQESSASPNSMTPTTAATLAGRESWNTLTTWGSSTERGEDLQSFPERTDSPSSAEPPLKAPACHILTCLLRASSFSTILASEIQASLLFLSARQWFLQE